jgi:hypothetical protein
MQSSLPGPNKELSNETTHRNLKCISILQRQKTATWLTPEKAKGSGSRSLTPAWKSTRCSQSCSSYSLVRATLQDWTSILEYSK